MAISNSGDYDKAFQTLRAFDQELNGAFTEPLHDYSAYLSTVADLQTYSKLWLQDYRKGTETAFDWLASQPSEKRLNLYHLYSVVNNYIHESVIGADSGDLTDDDMLDTATYLALKWPSSFSTVNSASYVPKASPEMHPEISSPDDTEARILSQRSDVQSRLASIQILTQKIQRFSNLELDVKNLLKLQTELIADIIDKLNLR